MEKEKNLLIGINARYSHTNPALAILALACHRKGVSLETLEFSVNKPFMEMLRDIYLVGAKRLIFSCYIWNIELVIRLSQSLKAIDPSIIIIWGGSEMYGDSGHWLNDEPCVDHILTGEGEVALPALLKTLENGHDLADVPNLFWRKDGKIIANSIAPFVDLSEEPFIYEEADFKDFEHKIVYYESSRGCPFNCHFCLSAEESPRYRRVELVKADILKMAAGGIKQIKFIDRTFNANVQRAMEIVGFLVSMAKDYPQMNFHLEIEPALLTKEFVDLLAVVPDGYIQLEAGVQSLNPESLKAVGRHDLWQKNKEVLADIIAKGNIHVHLDLIAGLPYEDMASFTKGFNELYSLRPHYLQLGFLKVLPGTILAKEAEKWGFNVTKEPPYQVLSTPWLSFGDIIALMWAELAIEQYYNNGFWQNTLEAAIEKWENGALNFYIGLGKAISSHGKANLETKAKLLVDFLVLELKEPKEYWHHLLVKDYEASGQKVPGVFR